MPHSPFYVPVSLGHTALLLSDVQTQVLNRFPPETQEAYLSKIQTLLDFFRHWQSPNRRPPRDGLHDGVPMIIHYALPLGKNQNAFVSPYNKLAQWVATLHRYS
ncbi:hypothetical protein QBC46DRAFT_394242 [Diplogelasinospora grovesii]|uniref:Uncharacterized protein n=1 Tax=Diplogelasinospora grovesii TaxID=303347 RepID=A0AAN6N093_9PEZI|nr:hypothetical protein QBC46DRAFT_394242 [Diplogelasinospora grovesii]